MPADIAARERVRARVPTTARVRSDYRRTTSHTSRRMMPVIDGEPVDIVELLEQAHYEKCRRSFKYYRRALHPGMKWGWFTDDVSDELQIFYEDLIDGKAPVLALSAPPQHGKSMAIADFISWIAGKASHLKSIFASYSEKLGAKTERDVERIMQGSVWRKTFPDLPVIGGPGWTCNTELIEYPTYEETDDDGRLKQRGGGSFMATTVEGQVTGFGLHLGVIDDPVKNRREANSKNKRDSTWSWFTNDFYSRFDQMGGLLLIMTRWHIDDLLGRAIRYFGKTMRQLRYAAIALKDEFRDDVCVRRKGEALFPQWKSRSFLLKRRKILTNASWLSLYQQTPIKTGGGVLPIEKMRFLPMFNPKDVVATVRYFDKAGTSQDEEGGETAAYTCGVLIHRLHDNRFVIADIIRGRWSALEREEIISSTLQSDFAVFKNYRAYNEQEPGSGGKESAENTIRNNPGIPVFADKVGKAEGNKETRAEPFVAAVQGGNIWLIAAPWYDDWKEEVETWPSSRFKDQVDGAAGAYNKLTASAGFDYSLSGFQD